MRDENEIASHYLKLLHQLRDSPKYEFVASLKQIPKELGVYVIWDKGSEAAIYVGRTKNLRNRLSTHKYGRTENSQFRIVVKRKSALDSESDITNYVKENYTYQFVALGEFEDVVRFEHFVTAIFAPLFNIDVKQ